MDVSSITGQSAAQTSTAKLAEDFDTFLTLLTTQLKNQDPLSPMDTNEFTQQIVSFTEVEQSIATNRNLENMIALQLASSQGTAVSYLGKTVTMDGDATSLKNGAAQWNYDLLSNAADTQLVVSDTTGRVVYTTTGEISAGSHSFVWDGKDNAGNDLPEDAYVLQVTAIDDDGEAMDTHTSVTGLVTGIDLVGNQPTLRLGQTAYTLSSLLAIEETAASQSGP